MEGTAMALRQPVFCSSSNCDHWKEERIMRGSVYLGRRRRPVCEVLSSGFCDQGHLQYYCNNNSTKVGCSSASGKQEKSGKEKKKMVKKKKQLKLLKGLTRDLSTFSQIGFGLDSDAALLDQVKGNMISEAAEALLEHLQKIRAQEKELKRRMKEEKSRLKHGANCEMSSSSSSSSSDSECGEMIDMNQLKQANSTQAVLERHANSTQAVLERAEEPVVTPLVPSNIVGSDVNTKKIEVCMGGKCKKAGGGLLMEEFERAGVAVSGCKCMGKCRDGPNVRVLNDDGVQSVCVGVGLEDVNMIVDKLFAENQNRFQFAATAASAT